MASAAGVSTPPGAEGSRGKLLGGEATGLGCDSRLSFSNSDGSATCGLTAAPLTTRPTLAAHYICRPAQQATRVSANCLCPSHSIMAAYPCLVQCSLAIFGLFPSSL